MVWRQNSLLTHRGLVQVGPPEREPHDVHNPHSRDKDGVHPQEPVAPGLQGHDGEEGEPEGDHVDAAEGPGQGTEDGDDHLRVQEQLSVLLGGLVVVDGHEAPDGARDEVHGVGMSSAAAAMSPRSVWVELQNYRSTPPLVICER